MATGVTLHLGSKAPGAIKPVLHHVVMIGTHLAKPIPSGVILLRNEHPMFAHLWLVGHNPPSAWSLDSSAFCLLPGSRCSVYRIPPLAVPRSEAIRGLRGERIGGGLYGRSGSWSTGSASRSTRPFRADTGSSTRSASPLVFCPADGGFPIDMLPQNPHDNGLCETPSGEGVKTPSRHTR